MKTSALLAALLAALSLSACGGSGSSSSAVCDEYEKAFAEATKDVDAATKRDATCKTSLDALKGVPAVETPEEKAEEAKDAAEEAKEDAKDAAEEAKEAAEDAKEEAK